MSGQLNEIFEPATHFEPPPLIKVHTKTVLDVNRKRKTSELKAILELEIIEFAKANPGYIFESIMGGDVESDGSAKFTIRFQRFDGVEAVN